MPLVLGALVWGSTPALGHRGHELTCYGKLWTTSSQILLDLRVDLDHFEELILLDVDQDGALAVSELNGARRGVELYCRNKLLFLWGERNHPPVLYSIRVEPAVVDEEGMEQVPEQLLLRLRVRDFDPRRSFLFHSRFMADHSPDVCMVLTAELPTGTRVMALGVDDYLSGSPGARSPLPEDPTRRPAGVPRGRIVDAGDFCIEAFSRQAEGKLFLYTLKPDRATFHALPPDGMTAKLKVNDEGSFENLVLRPQPGSEIGRKEAHQFEAEHEGLRTADHFDLDLSLMVGGQQKRLIFRAGPIKKPAVRALYVCPAHLRHVSRTPGTCAVCGTRMLRLEGEGYVQEPFQPLHGGRVVRMPQMWQVLEGALPEPDLFRLYVYDRNGDLVGVEQYRADAQAWTRGHRDQSLRVFTLGPGPAPNCMEGLIDNPPEFPLRIKLVIDFNDGEGSRLAVFDFSVPTHSQ